MNVVGVDWGTSSLRVARLDADGGAIEEREFPRGILTVPAGGFADTLAEACGDWMKPAGTVAVICGMA
jgi:2-dehydro-3-deoxygalactonokinase